MYSVSKLKYLPDETEFVLIPPTPVVPFPPPDEPTRPLFVLPKCCDVKELG